jgi:hypothetical protein
MPVFFDWWQQASDLAGNEARRGFNSLGAWTLRRIRNDVVYNVVSPRIDEAIILAQEEADLWMLAGARGLSDLVAVRPFLDHYSAKFSYNLSLVR